MKEKWKDDESDKNYEEEIEEEMVQTESEDEVKEANKQVNGDAEAVQKLQVCISRLYFHNWYLHNDNDTNNDNSDGC